MEAYDPAMSMEAARSRYFRDNGLPADGGYYDAWIDFKVGPLPMPFPNSKARLRTVRYHDLHHILTGYTTDLRGECELSAWELGAGCRDFMAAWVLNLAGVGFGVQFLPRRTFRAFIRGRRSRSLYDLPIEDVLGRSVAKARADTGVAAQLHATARDVARFLLIAISGLVLGTVLFWTLVLPLVPVGIVLNFKKRSRARQGG